MPPAAMQQVLYVASIERQMGYLCSLSKSCALVKNSMIGCTSCGHTRLIQATVRMLFVAVLSGTVEIAHLVGKTNSNPKEETAHNEHSKLLGCCLQRSTRPKE